MVVVVVVVVLTLYDFFGSRKKYRLNGSNNGLIEILSSYFRHKKGIKEKEINILAVTSIYIRKLFIEICA